jgi:hypothetical protein
MKPEPRLDIGIDCKMHCCCCGMLEEAGGSRGAGEERKTEGQARPRTQHEARSTTVCLLLRDHQSMPWLGLPPPPPQKSENPSQ